MNKSDLFPVGTFQTWSSIIAKSSGGEGEKKNEKNRKAGYLIILILNWG